ncbi:hypothetical protein ACC734_39995, partial [Rhizobium ruizarguesonis]
MTAGLVLVRQRPGSAKGVIFMTIEDETGPANVVALALNSPIDSDHRCPEDDAKPLLEELG